MTTPSDESGTGASRPKGDEEPGSVDAAEKKPGKRRRITRRNLLIGANVVAGTALGASWWYRYNERFQRAAVAIVKADSYELPLKDLLASGLTELGVDRKWIRGKSVMLKPNLVDSDAAAIHCNTHPAVIEAAVELFRSWDAREVFLAEGPANCRDFHYLLDATGLGVKLAEMNLPHVDLNHDDVYRADNLLGFSKSTEFYLPKSLRRADVIVSMPKMKTHHWAGVTLSMKNLFGVMPGICYGWPKNVLHHAGIDAIILDLAGTIRPHLAIVDGIVGMEGDGPLMGTPKAAGVLVMGTNPTAVDAVGTRIMGFDPRQIPYLAVASGRLGPIEARHIEQRGESVEACATRFEILDHPTVTRFRPRG